MSYKQLLRPFFYLLIFLISLSQTIAQTPSIKWYKHIHDNFGPNHVYGAARTSAGGYVIVGFDTFHTFNANNYLNKSLGSDAYVMKTDDRGKISWKRYALMAGSFAFVAEAADGSYIAAGSHLGLDTSFMAARITTNGIISWSRAYGGSQTERAYQVRETNDGGLIIAGFSNSNDGLVVKRHPGSEVWLVKTDAGGSSQWAFTYGGSNNDTAFAICGTADGGFIVCGSSSSSDGDLNNNKGSDDGWVFKIDAAGTLQWQKNFGGSQQDVLNKIVRNPNDTYTLSGYSNSNDGDVTGNHGEADMWVINIDNAGNLVWSRLFGGSSDDAAYGLDTAAGSVLVTGYTTSDDGDVTGRAGGADTWVIGVAADGSLIWQKCAGTVRDEFSMEIISLPSGEFTTAGIVEYQNNSNSVSGFLMGFGAANTIKGTLFFDANNNGIKDAGESGFDHATIRTLKPGYERSAVPYNGLFELYVDTGNYTSTVQMDFPYYVTVPLSHNHTFSSYYNADSIGFAVQAVPNKNDLVLSIPVFGRARPGFEVFYKLVYKNTGTTDVSAGTITLVKDPRISYLNSTVVPSEIIGDTVRWNYTDLNRLDSASFYVHFTIPPPPTVNLGDTLRLIAWIDPVAGDETPSDDTVIVNQVVVGSFDPNDKTEANGGVITEEQASNGDYLHYLIRFQNTGTDTAFSVMVRDTLEARLDKSTFEMIDASHPYQLTIENDDKLIWTFSGIMLPDSNVNEPASNGYIAFRIKPSATVEPGDTIKNDASIYFDFNLPVATNVANTIVVEISPLPVSLVYFNAEKNGKFVNLTWKTAMEENASHFEIQRAISSSGSFITIGSTGATNLPEGNTYTFRDDNPGKGYNYYRLKSVDRDGSADFSKTAIVNFTAGSEFIYSINPNPASDKVKITLNGAIDGIVKLEINDFAGRQVMARNLGRQNGSSLQTELHVGKLAKGTYILRVSIGKKVETHKLVIQ